MASEKLIVDECPEGYYLVWYFPEEEDTGGFLGDADYAEGSLSKAKTQEERETIAAHFAVKGLCDFKSSSYGFIFESKSKAKAALTAANAAIKVQRSEKPWPEWAKTALAAGWKAPKGWKP